jgi:hypothetical protein
MMSHAQKSNITTNAKLSGALRQITASLVQVSCRIKPLLNKKMRNLSQRMRNGG